MGVSDGGGPGGGQREKSWDHLIKVILFLLYLFRTCHLVTRPLCEPRLADSHFGSLEQSGPELLAGLPSPTGAEGQCLPRPGHCPCQE